MEIKLESKYSFLIFFILTFLIASPDILYHALNNRWSEAIFAYLICTALFACPLFIFRNFIKVYLWLLLPFGLLAIGSICSVAVYNVNLNFDIYLIILNTTWHEATELLKSYYIYIIVALAFYLLLYLYLIRKIPGRLERKKALVLSLSGLVFLILSPVFRSGKEEYIPQVKVNVVEFYPGSIYYAGEILQRQNSIVEQFAENTKNFKFNARQKTDTTAQQVYVMILGETSRYDHWGINGYSRPTSPKLNKRKDQLFSFSDVSSGAFLTEYSIPMLITRATPKDYKRHYYEKSILSLYKEAGFKTYWLSNQFDYGNISIHAKEADTFITMSTVYEATKNVHLDMELVKLLKKVLEKKEKKVFIVLHTLGSHYNYDARYPDEFEVFKPTAESIEAKPSDASKKDYLVNSYDNSILYTDAVIDSTISLIAHTKAVSWVSFISDHGEEMFDDSRQLSLHGFPVPSKYISHIPWFVWVSDAYQQFLPDKVQNLKENLNAKIGAQNIFYSLADLGNISYAGEDTTTTKSVAADNFQPEPRLILGGKSELYNVNDFSVVSNP